VLTDVEAEAHELDALPKAEIVAEDATAQTVRPRADQEVYVLNRERLEVAARKKKEWSGGPKEVCTQPLVFEYAWGEAAAASIVRMRGSSTGR
jgi:hypothetical protein